MPQVKVPTIEYLTDSFFNLKVQRGTIILNNARIVTVVFTTPFQLVPVVLLTMREPANKVVTLTSVTTVNFSIDMGNVTTVNIDWIAIER